jgi:hypothetical protein
VTFRSNPKKQAESEGWIEWFRDYIPPHEDPFEPVVDLHYPLINDISCVNLSQIRSDAHVNNTVVALLTAQIYWRDLIRSILPDGSNGIVVIVDCPCNEKFSYQMFGSEVKYLGVGDLHDAKYQHLGRSGNLSDYTSVSVRKDAYSGHPLVNDFGPYTLHIYPSDLMNADFKTSNGVIFMVSTICIFAFSAIVFFLYDRKVERRQKVAASTAQRSSALPSSLFPSTVRNQLIETQAECDVVTNRQWRLRSSAVGNVGTTSPTAVTVAISYCL